MTESQERPKIIVDDNWKERVQAEKEAFKKQDTPATTSNEQVGSNEQDDSNDPPLPPASFSFLLSSMATQTLLALGQIPAADGSEAQIEPQIARHHIDMLAVIEEKTKGNLSPAEAKMLSDVLHDLRMMYIAVTRQ